MSSATTQRGDVTRLNLKHRVPPAAGISIRELLRTEYAPRKDLLDNILPERGSGLLVAPPFSNKSQFVLQLGLAVATKGQSFLGREPQHGPALLALLEHTRDEVQRRLRTLLSDAPSPDREIQICCRGDLLPESEGGVAKLREICRKLKPVFIAIDSFVAWRGERKATQDLFHADYRALDKLRRLGDELGAFILLPHHSTRYARGGDATRDAMGTGGLGAGASVMLKLDWKQGSPRGTLTVQGNEVPHSKVPLAWAAEAQQWDLGEQVTCGRPASKMRAAKEFLRNQLKDGPRLHSRITEAARTICSPKTLKNAKKELGIQSQGHGKSARWALPVSGSDAKPMSEDDGQ